MRAVFYTILILTCSSCASLGYENYREINNSFSIKVKNVDNCTLSIPKLKDENTSMQLKQGETVTLSLRKLSKKNRQLLISHPEYESQTVIVKRTPRVRVLLQDIILSPFLFGLPLLIDPFKSDFYKVSQSSKEISINLKISRDGINKEIDKCNQNLDIEAYNSLTKEYPYMFDTYKITSDISKIVNKKLLKSIEDANINSYNSIIKSYRNYIDTNRIAKDLSEINKNIEITGKSDKISAFLKQNCENALYLDLNESSKTLIFKNTNPEKLKNANIKFVEDRFNAKNRALYLSSCPPIAIEADYKSYNNDVAFGFWYKPIKNESAKFVINSENLNIKLEESLLEINNSKEIKTLKFPTSLSYNEWNFIYIHLDNDQNSRYEKIGHIKLFINDKNYTSDLNYGFAHPSNFVLEGNGIIDEFVIFHDMTKDVDWVRKMDETKIEEYFLEQRLAKEAKEKKEFERLAKIQRLKDQGIDWIVGDGGCWSKSTKDGIEGSKFMSANETYCFEENGICTYKTGFYIMPSYINKNIPLYQQEHLAIYKLDEGSERTYEWKLNDSKDELIIFYHDNPENELKRMKVDQSSKRIDW
jgi:hypothetical protein